MLHLQLFGSPRISNASASLTQFKSRKVEALLFYLAITPGQHRRAYLADLLWSEWPEEKALSNLRYALWNLRQVLGERPLSSGRLNITFQQSNDIWIDVNVFRELLKPADTNANSLTPESITVLQQATDLYCGEFLAGFEMDEAPVFASWLHQQRMALHEMAAGALTRLGAYYTSHHYDFSHNVIRAVVYADLSQARRQIMHTQLGDALEQALTHYEGALINFSRLEQTRRAAFCLISIGNIHLMHNRFAQALTHFKQAKAYAKAGGYQDALIWSLNSIANMYLFLGDLEAAQEISQKALMLCGMIRFDSGASTGLVIQGYIKMLNGELDQTQAQYERAWSINQEMGQTLRMADVQCCLGHLCLLRGEAERAVAHFRQAEALCGSFYSGRAIEARSHQAVAHLALKQLAEALNCSHHAVVWLSGREHNMYAPQRVYFNQYQVLLAQGEMEEAQDALVKAHTIVGTQANKLAEIYPATIDDDRIYERFLNRLPWNREIMTVWDRLPLSTSVTVLRSLHGYPG